MHYAGTVTESAAAEAAEESRSRLSPNDGAGFEDPIQQRSMNPWLNQLSFAPNG